MCTSTIRASTVSGNLVVPQGASCVLDTVSITGNIRVLQNASLSVQAYVEPSSISGNILADHCASVLLQGTVTVGGNLQIQNCTGKSGFVGPGTKIYGNFLCQNNQGPCEAWLGEVVGSALIQNNTASLASDVSLTTIGGNLLCQQNTPAPTHNAGPNWITQNLLGQCAQNLGFGAFGSSIAAPGTPAGKPVDARTWPISPISRFRTRRSYPQSSIRRPLHYPCIVR